MNKLFYFGKVFIFSFLFLLSAKFLQAQISSGNAFLKGNYVEVAIGPCGAFASTVEAPVGYHSRGQGNQSTTGQLGFIADAAKDGWGIGNPDFIGDYFLPGTPEEGWGISINGNNYNNNLICSVSDIPGSVINYTSTSTERSATWQGSVEGLTITSRTYVPVNSVYFVTEVSITNNSLSPKYNVFFMRNVDPDQGVNTPGGGGIYTTNNNIVYQNPDVCNRALVSSLSQYGNYYLGLGSIDSRARVCFGGFSNRSAEDLYNGNGFSLTGSNTDDVAIAISFKLGTIEANQTVKIAYAYILDQAQLTEALSETNLNFNVNDITYASGNNASVCSGSSNLVSINNPGTYTNWSWSPSTGLNTTSGSTVNANISTPVNYTATGSGACGTVSVSIPLVPVSLPSPGPAGTISGATVPNPGQSGLVYSVPSISNATSYIWSIPPGFVITSSSSTSNTITVTASNAGGCGYIRVYGKNACGNGTQAAMSVCVPGISTGTLSTSFSTALCSPLSANVNFSSTNISFISGNVFDVQLSDSTGDFTSPTIVGSLTTTSVIGSIPINIPSGITGSAYRIRITSSNPAYISTDNGAPLFMSTSIPLAPTTISQTLYSNSCGARVYRYTSNAVAGATGYSWTIPGTIGGFSSGYSIDSGDANTSRVIRVKYSSNLAASATDSLRVRAYSGCGSSGNKASKIINTLVSAPSAPTSITITPISIATCGAKVFRYTAPTLTNGTSTIVPATGWVWSFVGTLGLNAVIDSGTLTSRVVKMRFTNNAPAGVGDSVKLAFSSSCGNSAFKSMKLTNTLLGPPLAPASITATLVNNICGAKVYRYAAPTLPVATGTAMAATGYVWSFVGVLGANATVDSGNLTSRILKIKFTSDAAAVAGDSARVYYTSACGNSPVKSIKLPNTLLTKPASPASVTITLVSNACGARIYRYQAPVLPTATATSVAATGYIWSFVGNLSSTAVLDSGTLSGRTLKMKFISNAAAATGDSAKVLYTSVCGNTVPKSVKLTNTILTAPAMPTAITITSYQTNVCSQRIYRFAAPSLPIATTTAEAATGYLWSFVGTLGLNAVIDSGTLTGRVVRMRFSSNAAASIGDSARVLYTSATCGNSPRKAVKLINTLLGPPPVPTGIAITNVINNCGNRVYRYVAPSLPTATATTAAATGYIWSFVGSLGSNATVDSGSLTSQIVRMKFTSNATAAAGDSVRLQYSSDATFGGCGISAIKASKLSNALITCSGNTPVITYYSPQIGSTGDIVTIKGRYFTGVSLVKFGANNATSFTLINDSTLIATVGVGSTGSVTVTNAGGSTSKYGFVYQSGCWKMVTSGDGFTIGLKSNGTLWAFGRNTFGQLGDGTTITRLTPVQIGTASDWQSVATGDNHTVALKKNGTLWAWGYNSNGQLGDGSMINKSTPIQIGTTNNWQSVCASYLRSVALKIDGTIWTWGKNNHGQLGDGTLIDKSSPTQVGSASDWRYISAGSYHTTAIKNDGSLWSWGYNFYGQLGDSTNTNKSIPTRIGTGNNWNSVSAGGYFTVALKNDSTRWAWGDNTYGSLGDGTNTHKNSPIQIAPSFKWTSVAAGAWHAFSTLINGTLWACGYNAFGQLGDGTILNRNSTVQIGVATDWMYLSPAWFHSAVVKADGSLSTWGKNDFGQLGNNTTTNSSIPINLTCTGRFATFARSADSKIFNLAESFTTNIFPNPSNSSFNLFIKSSKKEKVFVSISDTKGVVVSRFMCTPFEQNTITDFLQPGVYFVELIQGKEKIVKKIIKQ